MMKLTFAPLAALVALMLASQPALGGRLDIAIVQYATDRDPDQLAAAFAASDLAEITNADSVQSGSPEIRGGSVVFTQTLSIASGSKIQTSTRLGNQRADANVSMSGNTVSVEVSIEEGIEGAMRRFTRSVYSGSGPVTPRQTTIIGLKQSSGRTQTAVKGRSKLVNTSYSTVVLAQYTP